MAEPVLLDEVGTGADWNRGRSWDLPSDWDEFLVAIGGEGALPSFMQLPVARAMPLDLWARARRIVAGTSG